MGASLASVRITNHDESGLITLFHPNRERASKRAEGAAETKPKGLSRRPRPATSDKRGDRKEGVERRALCITRDRKHRKSTMVRIEPPRLHQAERNKGSEQKHKQHHRLKSRMIREKRTDLQMHTQHMIRRVQVRCAPNERQNKSKGGQCYPQRPIAPKRWVARKETKRMEQSKVWSFSVFVRITTPR